MFNHLDVIHPESYQIR